MLINAGEFSPFAKFCKSFPKRFSDRAISKTVGIVSLYH